MPRQKRHPEHFEISLNLDPYLIKYCAAGNEGNFVYINSENELLFNYVTGSLIFPKAGWRPKRIPNDRKLVLRIPYYYIRKKRCGSHMSEETKRDLAVRIEVAFWSHLYEMVMDLKTCEKEKELVAIRNIRADFGITEDDFKEESMYKRYRRIKGKKLKRLKTRV